MTKIPTVIGALGIIPKDFEERLEELEIRRRIEDTHITALLSLLLLKRIIILNTGKSPGDLRRLAVTQPPVKDNSLTLV